MREIRASDAKAHLPSLLDAVERGETVIITRHGRPVARLVPDADRRQVERDRTHEAVLALRKTMPSLSLDDILSARHEGHKY
ncbi:type II toxin-antitoxin system Phd/YefM family antitoxin [Beijerinckia sp. L45]|uniref:type II toxin-antitoxin system Phd/YefM family antitoxin n=1 Tax=Beijerinckia sp. L45 TaxID=1641855 RepID=UPI00131D9930|nr:type II toxin-antitoxin system prevent-host-death family antitoxin [Beijerinckia sp. L45]